MPDPSGSQQKPLISAARATDLDSPPCDGTICTLVSKSVFAIVWNAIHRSSGDHRGVELIGSGMDWATTVGLERARVVTTSAGFPPRTWKTASRRLSWLMSAPEIAAAIRRGVPPNNEISQLAPSTPALAAGA